METDAGSAPYGGGNAVLDQLPPEIRADLEPHLTMYREDESAVRVARDRAIEAVYFPIDAIYSIIVDIASGNAYEVDVIGRDGMVCAEIALGAEISPRTIICQSAGFAARLSRDRFSIAAAQSREFRQAVQEAARRQWFVSQQTVACNAAHPHEQRAARWILMTQDAVGRPQFRMRAEFASMMLGMPKNAVLEPLRLLVQRGCIFYENENLTILSRHALHESACECYERQKLAPFIRMNSRSGEI